MSNTYMQDRFFNEQNNMANDVRGGGVGEWYRVVYGGLLKYGVYSIHTNVTTTDFAFNDL